MHRHLRDSFRSLRRRPGFAAAAVLTLAMGIGANVAVFTLVEAVVLEPLPYARPDGLLWIWHSSTVGEKGPFSIPDFMEYRRGNHAFEGLAAFRLWNANVTGQGDAERITGIRVSENFFDLLSVSALRGRTFTTSDGDPGLVALSHGLWQRRFGADADLVGRTVVLNGVPHTVVGVLPPGFVFPLPEAEFAVPLAVDLDPYRDQPAVNGLRLIGRLKPAVTLAQAEAELEQTTARLRSLYPKDNAGKRGVNLVPVQQEIVGEHGRMLLLLWAAVSIVLLLTCANLASLFLTQAGARRREFAIRLTLGAGWRRVFGQLLVEGLLLAALGGLAGVLLASAAIDLVLALTPAEIPRARTATVDSTVLAFAVGLSVLTGVLLALLPAFQAAQSDPLPILHAASRTTTRAGTRTRARLLAAQAALAVVLAVGAGLFLRSFERLLSVAPGFDTPGLLTARLALPQSRYNDAGAISQFVDRLSETMESLAAVRQVAAVSLLPLTGYRSTADFAVEGRPVPPDDQPFAHYRLVTAGYFRTMGIPVVRGREFTRHDRADTERVVVINQTLAQRYWPAGDAVGSALVVDDGDSQRRLQIVGVVADVRHLGLDQPIENDLYIALPQMPAIDVGLLGNLYLVVRSDGGPRLRAAAVREKVAAVDRDVAASEVRSMEDVLARAVAPRRFGLTLLATFALAALLLVALGVFAVTNQMTIQRRRELAIRRAVGAGPVDVVRLVTTQTLKPVAAGVLVGSLLALSGGRLVRGLLYEASAIDIWSLVAGAFSVAIVSWLATVIPTVRASRVQLSGTLNDQ